MGTFAASTSESDPTWRRPFWGRLALLALPLWWLIALGSGSATWCFLDYPNLAFHEAGHLFFSPFGSTAHYLGGTLGQLLVPGLLIGYFIVRQRQPFAAAICLFWFGENFINIAIYMADARELALPLVGGGDHDWNELFFRFGLLGEDSVRRVSSTTHSLGVVGMSLGLLWALFFVMPQRVQVVWCERALLRWPWMTWLIDQP